MNKIMREAHRQADDQARNLRQQTMLAFVAAAVATVIAWLLGGVPQTRESWAFCVATHVVIWIVIPLLWRALARQMMR